MKLWKETDETLSLVERFTVGNDPELDLLLAPYDILGSVAHVRMLVSAGIISEQDGSLLTGELKDLHRLAGKGELRIEAGVEDIHSQVELWLVKRLGEAGKRIHTGRSRNDQILLDIRLFSREGVACTFEMAAGLFEILMKLSDTSLDMPMPGYTHMQAAMPSTFGLWFASFAESLCDDLEFLWCAYRIIDHNPLGSAAGYGSSFGIDRLLTTSLLGFEGLSVNSIHAQAGRGKTEWIVSTAMASLAMTLSRLAMDICLYSGQDYGFFSLPPGFTTGSSIMPHKKNPDIFELIRAKCNRIKAIPTTVQQVTANLPTGYHRDYQLLKEIYLPMFTEIQDILGIYQLALPGMKVNEISLSEDKYSNVYSVEAVNQLVQSGMSFREAYQQVSASIRDGSFSPGAGLKHTHIGSIDNPGNDLIRKRMEKIRGMVDFTRAREALKKLSADG